METNTSSTPASTESVNGATPSPEEKMFEIRFEHHPNDDIVTVHTRKKFPKYDSEYGENRDNPKSLYRSLLQTHGIIKVRGQGFELSITKGSIFTWEELKPSILRSLKKHFSDGLEIKELPASHPSPEYLAYCRKEGSDIRNF